MDNKKKNFVCCFTGVLLKRKLLEIFRGMFGVLWVDGESILEGMSHGSKEKKNWIGEEKLRRFYS
jgi:hypothetical protein